MKLSSNLDLSRSGEKDFLSQYDYKKYFRPSCASDILLLRLGSESFDVLLIQRKNHPYRNYFAMPGGFMDESETSFECARRELLEETGIDKEILFQAYVASSLDRDPRSRNIGFVYGCIGAEFDYKPGDDAYGGGFFDLSEIIESQQIPMAFDHRELIEKSTYRFLSFILNENLFELFVGAELLERAVYVCKKTLNRIRKNSNIKDLICN